MIGFDAYLRNDAGTEIVPTEKADWRHWVSASKTRNWCLGDPLLDWLQLYGLEKGYERDAEPDLRTDFQEFVFRKGREFETAVVRHLGTIEPVFVIASGVEAVTSLEACRETFEAMRRGEPIIHQGVLRNPQTRTYGAPGMGAAKLKLDKKWHAANDHLAYMVQTFLYSEALGRIQGYHTPTSYLLGRGWSKGTNDCGSTNCMDRLASVPQDHEVRGGDPDGSAVSPSRITTEVDVWGKSRGIEFYVDLRPWAISTTISRRSLNRTVSR